MDERNIQKQTKTKTHLLNPRLEKRKRNKKRTTITTTTKHPLFQPQVGPKETNKKETKKQTAPRFRQKTYNILTVHSLFYRKQIKNKVQLELLSPQESSQ